MSGIVVWAISQKSPVVSLISIIAILGFWILDTYFKIYQNRSMYRMGRIEAFLNNRTPYKNKGLKEAFEQGQINVKEFPIHDPIGNKTSKEIINNKTIIDEYYKTKTNFWRCFKLHNVSTLYVALTIGALILSIYIYMI